MADMLSTKRDYRAEARPVFEAMWRLLQRIADDEDMQASMSRDMAREIEDVLDRAARVPFFV